MKNKIAVDLSPTPSKEAVIAANHLKYEMLADLAGHAASYWHSMILAAERRDSHLIGFHARQIQIVTKEAFRLARELLEADSARDDKA